MKTARCVAASCLVLAALPLSCSSDDAGKHEPGAGSVTKEIGPEGGSVETTCGKVDVPAGALDRVTQVHVQPVTPELEGPLEARGKFCRVDFGDAAISKPVELALPFDPAGFAEGKPPPTLFAIGQLGQDSAWSAISTPKLPAGNVLFATTTSGGTFGPALALATNTSCMASISFCAAILPGPGPTPPPTWTPIPGSGTGTYEMGSLYKYWKSPGYVSEGLGALAVACNWDGLSAETQLAILTKCKGLPCPYDLVCAAKLAAEELQKDPGNVCRHYAWAVREAVSLLGYPADFEVGWDGVVGHAWVEVVCGGKRYALDGFAGTYISLDGPVAPYCGNETKEGTEECDGDASVCSQPSECSSSCKCVPLCGNSKLDEGEECDGNTQCPSGKTCQSCLCKVPPVCGNAVLEPGEDCDTGFTCASGQQCQSCKCVAAPPAVCGNGKVETGEQCEADAQCDSSSECKACQCTPKCGNGKLDGIEECDGAAAACGSGKECVSCKCQPLCGNFKVDAGEQCDGAGGAQCTGVGVACYACKCQKFVQCAGLTSLGTCTACCEGAATSSAEFSECMSVNCTGLS